MVYLYIIFKLFKIIFDHFPFINIVLNNGLALGILSTFKEKCKTHFLNPFFYSILWKMAFKSNIFVELRISKDEKFQIRNFENSRNLVQKCRMVLDDLRNYGFVKFNIFYY